MEEKSEPKVEEKSETKKDTKEEVKALESHHSTSIVEPSIELPQPIKVRLGYSKVHFRGVFATQDIESEELVERCPMVPLEFRTKYHKDTQLFNYLYTHRCECKDCKDHGAVFLMVLGYGMIYNHQDTPNTVWRFNHQEKVADVVATRPIKAGEEIFVSYGPAYFSNKKKVTLVGGELEIVEDDSMPPEWRTWIKENIERGVDIVKIKEILYENKFDKELVKKVLREE